MWQKMFGLIGHTNQYVRRLNKSLSDRCRNRAAPFREDHVACTRRSFNLCHSGRDIWKPGKFYWHI
jgi:hypothetical protein